MNIDELKNAIRETFKNRNTTIKYIYDFKDEELDKLQNYWNAHFYKVNEKTKEILPKQFNIVVNEINNFLSVNKIIE